MGFCSPLAAGPQEDVVLTPSPRGQDNNPCSGLCRSGFLFSLIYRSPFHPKGSYSLQLCVGSVASLLKRLSWGILIHIYKCWYWVHVQCGISISWSLQRALLTSLPVVLTNLKSGLASLLGLLEISNLIVSSSVFSWQAVFSLVTGGKVRFYFATFYERSHFLKVIITIVIVKIYWMITMWKAPVLPAHTEVGRARMLKEAIPRVYILKS